MNLHIKELLTFYDEKDNINRKHASAITGMIGEDFAIAIFCHYLSSLGKKVRCLDEPCTEGKKKGKWLDKWLLVESNHEEWLYQAEVKNWSAHSIGGEHLALNATKEELSKFKQKKWKSQWDEDKKCFSHEQVKKVLSVMRSPLASKRVVPLIIYWFAIHPDGADDCFFEIETKGTFNHAEVFSISAYLRSLTMETIQVEMPRVEERFRILQKLVTSPLTNIR